MKTIKTAEYKKAFDMGRYESEGMLGEDVGRTEEFEPQEGRTVGEGQEALKQRGYRLVKNPLFGGEEWKNDQGELIYSVPGGGVLSLAEYIEQYVKMFSPVNREDEITKRQWLNYKENK